MYEYNAGTLRVYSDFGRKLVHHEQVGIIQRDPKLHGIHQVVASVHILYHKLR